MNFPIFSNVSLNFSNKKHNPIQFCHTHTHSHPGPVTGASAKHFILFLDHFGGGLFGLTVSLLNVRMSDDERDCDVSPRRNAAWGTSLQASPVKYIFAGYLLSIYSLRISCKLCGCTKYSISLCLESMYFLMFEKLANAIAQQARMQTRIITKVHYLQLCFFATGWETRKCIF